MEINTDKLMNRKGISLGSLALGIGIGLCLGGVTALLAAPQSGAKTRAMIGDQSGKIKDRVVDMAGSTRDRVTSTAGNVRDQAMKMIGRNPSETRMASASSPKESKQQLYREEKIMESDIKKTYDL